MTRFILALALFLLPSTCWAQCNGVFPNNTICGNISGVGNIPSPVPNSALTGVPGGSNGQTQYNNSGNFGGYTPSGDVAVVPSTGVETIQPGVVTGSKIAAGTVANSNLTTGAANTLKGSVNGTTTSDLAIATCSAIYQATQWLSGTGWQCGINPVLPSRATAATLNLSAFTSVQTLGYTTPGDGGGAYFKNVTTTPFRDSQIATGTISGNGTSGCTTNSYLGTSLSGGTGTGAQANITAAGGIITVITLTSNGGNGYTVGDVLSATITGCSTTVHFTVSTLSTPTCSFSDTASNHLQMIVDSGNYINIRQCGARMNWTAAAGDGGSTNDTTPIQNALNFAADTVQPTIDAGGVAGQTVLVPFGNALSDALLVPFGVSLTGHNAWSSQIKFTDAMNAATIPLTICDPTTHLACFGSRVMNLTLKAGSGNANSNIPMVFSNNLQQMAMLWRVAFYPGKRGCVQYDTGFGGAAQVGFVEIECTAASVASTNAGFNFTNIGTTLIYLKNVNVEFGGSGVNNNGIQAVGGFIDVDNFHCEGLTICIFLNNTGSTSTGAFRLHNLSGGANCTDLVLKQAGSVASDLIVGMAVPNGCTNTVLNGASATTTPVIPDTTY